MYQNLSAEVRASINRHPFQCFAFIFFFFRCESYTFILFYIYIRLAMLCRDTHSKSKLRHAADLYFYCHKQRTYVPLVVQKLCNDIQDYVVHVGTRCVDTTEHIERYTKCFLLILFLCIYIAKEQRTCIQHFKPIPCMCCDVVLHSHLFILLVYYYFRSFWSLLQELIKYLVCKGCLCDFIAQKICFVCWNARASVYTVVVGVGGFVLATAARSGRDEVLWIGWGGRTAIARKVS